MLALRLFLVVSGTLILTAFCQHSIVGYQNQEIHKGVNKIEVELDHVTEPFTTLDEILRFDPPKGIVGDVLSLNLDGRHQRFRISAYDGTNYTMQVMNSSSKEYTTLDTIPRLKTFWIEHNSTNAVSICQAGMVAADKMRSLRQGKKQCNLSSITIRLVDGVDTNAAIRLNLTGGRIGIEK